MIYYLIKRILYFIPILLGINIITFALFFLVNSPDDMARMQLGQKHVSIDAINMWKAQRGYDLPLFYNAKEHFPESLTQTLFYQKSLKLFIFDFGESDEGRDISYDILNRAGPSLAVAIPILFLGIAVNILIAMIMAHFRNSRLDVMGMIVCTILMSISAMFFIIGGQFFFGKMLKIVPISGYDSGFKSIKFIILPILVATLSGIGSGARWYRALFLEELDKDYVKTARAKGLKERTVLFKHVLKNAMLPILTGVVVIIPSLFMGSLILESFFGIPGLGSYIIDAIAAQDFAVTRAMVFLGSILYILGLILTDISYLLIDPRVKFR